MEVRKIPEADDPLTTLDSQIEAYAAQIAERPDDIGALMQFAEANLIRGHTLEALTTYQKVVHERPDEAEVRLALARIYMAQNMFQEAYAEVESLIASRPTLAAAHLLLKKLQQGAPVPERFKGLVDRFSDYLPEPADLEGVQSKLEQERGKLLEEIEDFKKAKNGNEDGEPVLDYYIICAQARCDFVDDAARILEEWKQKLEEQQERERQERERQEHEREERQEEERRQRERMEQEERERQDRERREREEQERLERERREQEEREEQERLEREREAAEKARRVSPEREAFYGSIQGGVGDVVTTLGKTKNVAAVLAVAGDGVIVYKDLKESVPEEDLSEFVKAGVGLFRVEGTPDGGPGPFEVWVLEFEKGILVLQAVHPEHVLIVLGGTGANFGALKFAIDKARPLLGTLLQGAPAIGPTPEN